jgi:hypothetical protein
MVVQVISYFLFMLYKYHSSYERKVAFFTPAQVQVHKYKYHCRQWYDSPKKEMFSHVLCYIQD